MHVLIMSASVGAGHLRAAQALELAFRQVAPQATVRNVDALSLTNAAFRRLYGRAYLDLVNKAPHILGYLYDLMDRPRSPKRRSDRPRLSRLKENARRLGRPRAAFDIAEKVLALAIRPPTFSRDPDPDVHRDRDRKSVPPSLQSEI